MKSLVWNLYDSSACVVYILLHLFEHRKFLIIMKHNNSLDMKNVDEHFPMNVCPTVPNFRNESVIEANLYRCINKFS